ncbi:hypothetical protein [Lactobacillus kitasatonis]|uniref:aldose epimerase family protein n=1 Tax=Lactobacillus kitasatonis TaxID=237446 RepID=UPI003F662CCE
MKTSFVKYGRKNNKDLCEITLENDHGMVAKVLNYGATLEKVLVDLEAVSDKLTIFNLVNHTYFNLGERAEDLNLQLNADYYLPVDESSLPDRGMEQVAGTAFDFRKTKRIGDALTSDDAQIKLRNGIDHPFILNGNNPATTLSSRKHKLTVRTNAPALVLYAGNHFNHTGIADNIGQYDGITFEAQCPPAEGNDLGEITLLPFEKFKRVVDWKFE